MMFPSNISSIRIYGSRARGDADDISDLDVLIVQREKTPPIYRHDLEDKLRDLGSYISFSWYSETAIARMYREGHLFAWHLYKESTKIDAIGDLDFIDYLSAPNPYREAVADVDGFRRIIDGVAGSIAAAAGNACYEAGLLYVCCRNLAMIASSYLADGPYFNRRSPFLLADKLQIPFPLSREDHDLNMRARHFGGRGIKIHRSHDRVKQMAADITLWGGGISQYVKTREAEHEREKSAFC